MANSPTGAATPLQTTVRVVDASLVTLEHTKLWTVPTCYNCKAPHGYAPPRPPFTAALRRLPCKPDEMVVVRLAEKGGK